MTKLDYEQVTGGFSEADKARISKFNEMIKSAVHQMNVNRERLVRGFLDDALGAGNYTVDSLRGRVSSIQNRPLQVTQYLLDGEVIGQISDVDDLGLVWPT